jgi:hypothetical protein
VTGWRTGAAGQIGCSNETLALPLITEDPHLLETLRPFCEEAARARNTTHGLVEEGTNFAEVVDGLRRLPETKRWGTAR